MSPKIKGDGMAPGHFHVGPTCEMCPREPLTLERIKQHISNGGYLADAPKELIADDPVATYWDLSGYCFWLVAEIERLTKENEKLKDEILEILELHDGE